MWLLILTFSAQSFLTYLTQPVIHVTASGEYYVLCTLQGLQTVFAAEQTEGEIEDTEAGFHCPAITLFDSIAAAAPPANSLDLLLAVSGNNKSPPQTVRPNDEFFNFRAPIRAPPIA